MVSKVEPKRNAGQGETVAKERPPMQWGVSAKAVGAVLKRLPLEMGADLAMTLLQHAAGIGSQKPSGLAEMAGMDLIEIAKDRPKFFCRLLATMAQLVAEEYSIRPAKRAGEAARPDKQTVGKPQLGKTRPPKAAIREV